MPETMTTVPAGHGRALHLATGKSVKLVNTPGTQVVDCWALNARDGTEFMSHDCTRIANLRVNPVAGDVLLTNRRRPILTLLEDSSPGIHDTLFAACDPRRYRLLGVSGYHRNCQDNFAEALRQLGVEPQTTAPGPLNIFMNIPIGADRNSLRIEPAACSPGDHVVLRAEMDCVVVFSACPQDIAPINGPGGAPPRDVHYRVLD